MAYVFNDDKTKLNVDNLINLEQTITQLSDTVAGVQQQMESLLEQQSTMHNDLVAVNDKIRGIRYIARSVESSTSVIVQPGESVTKRWNPPSIVNYRIKGIIGFYLSGTGATGARISEVYCTYPSGELSCKFRNVFSSVISPNITFRLLYIRENFCDDNV